MKTKGRKEERIKKGRRTERRKELKKKSSAGFKLVRSVLLVFLFVKW